MEKIEVEVNEITPKTRQPTPDLEIVVNPANLTASKKLKLAETFGSHFMLFSLKSSYYLNSWYFVYLFNDKLVCKWYLIDTECKLNT